MSRTRDVTDLGYWAIKPFVPRNVRGRRGPKCRFLGRKAPSVALLAREWPGFSPGPAYGPNSGNENSPARPTGFGTAVRIT